MESARDELPNHRMLIKVRKKTYLREERQLTSDGEEAEEKLSLIYFFPAKKVSKASLSRGSFLMSKNVVNNFEFHFSSKAFNYFSTFSSFCFVTK